jgi:hypothetical protein
MFGWFKKKDTAVEPEDYTDKYINPEYTYEYKIPNLSQSKIDDIYKKALASANKAVSQKTYQKTYQNQWSTIVPSAINAASSSILNINGNTNKVEVKTALEVNGRDIINELDEIKATLLIVTRDKKLEEKYPELKEAYDNYMEIKRGLGIAEKLYSTGKDNV